MDEETGTKTETETEKVKKGERQWRGRQFAWEKGDC